MIRFKFNPERHALSVALAVFISVLVHHYFSFSKEYWIILSAFMVSQTTQGTPLRQSLSFLTTILFALICSFLLLDYVRSLTIIYFILGTMFVGIGFITFWTRPYNKLYFLIFFLAVMFIAMFEQITGYGGTSYLALQNRILDTIIGGLIGIGCVQFIFPFKLEKEFRLGIIPILTALIRYSESLTVTIKKQKNNIHELENRKIAVEKALQAQQGLYPEWVYEVGFNPGLRSGFRFFLVNVERLVEVLFSINYLLTNETDKNLLKELAVPVEVAMQKNQELFASLLTYFEKNKLTETKSDFTTDISDLEAALKKIIPGSLELLDISPDYITLTALVKDIKDLRALLLQLVMALPTEKK